MLAVGIASNKIMCQKNVRKNNTANWFFGQFLNFLNYKREPKLEMKKNQQQKYPTNKKKQKTLARLFDSLSFSVCVSLPFSEFKRKRRKISSMCISHVCWIQKQMNKYLLLISVICYLLKVNWFHYRKKEERNIYVASTKLAWFDIVI